MHTKDIKKLYEKFRVPKNVIEHMETVERVCHFIARNLIAQNYEVDTRHLRYAALVHDIVKVMDFKGFDKDKLGYTYSRSDKIVWNNILKTFAGLSHEEAGAQIVEEMGDDIVAGMIRKHRFAALTDPNPEKRPTTIEEKVLYYADKRVKHDKVVSLKERISDGEKRYGINPSDPKEQENIKALHCLEEELLQMANLKPEDIDDDIFLNE